MLSLSVHHYVIGVKCFVHKSFWELYSEMVLEHEKKTVNGG